VNFSEENASNRTTVVFDVETENPADRQREGWQATLNNLKRHVAA
jgi:hypothetical protein